MKRERSSTRIARLFPIAALAWLPLLGCDEPSPGAHYSVVAGKVMACHAETGELRVRATHPGGDEATPEIVYCVVTRESEIYVNDEVRPLSEIQLGDEVELIGHRDPDPQTRRFVVSFAYLDHPLPPPAPPVFAPAAATTQESNENNATGATSGNTTQEE